MTTIGTVAGLNRFPVKSMQGDAPASVELDALGIVGDRRWALRDTETGKLVSAKRPRLWRAALDCRASGVGDEVTVTLPDGTNHDIDDPGLPVALEALFGRAVSVEEADGPQQGVYESDWPEIEGLTLSGSIDLPTNLTGEGTSFVDLGILHVLTTTSMQTLAATDPELVVDVRRFRPSILLDTEGLDGFPENEWTDRVVRIGEAEITIGDPAPRCVMTTVAQGDLPRQPGILQRIAEHNRRSNEMGTFACLGSYASVSSPGTISVGDPVELL